MKKNNAKKIIILALTCSLMNTSMHGVSWSEYFGAAWQSCVTAFSPKKVIATIAAFSSLSFLSYKVYKNFWQKPAQATDTAQATHNKKQEKHAAAASVSHAPAAAPVPCDEYQYWKNKCDELPANIHTKPHNMYRKTALSWHTFEATLNVFLAENKRWYLKKNNCWLENAPTNNDVFYDTDSALFKPFVQKMVIAPGTIVAIRGDLHGDIHSLLAYIDSLQTKGHLDGFSIKDKSKFHMLFLGDYVDRGNYGVEVLYTLMRLKIANPDNVTLVRGNHEDIGICSGYGFKDECRAKFAQKYVSLSHETQSIAQSIAASFSLAPAAARVDTDFEIKFKKITRLYDFLPAALYLGSGKGTSKDFMQCCHGGMEVGFNPGSLLSFPSPVAFSWIKELKRETEFCELVLHNHNLEQKQALAKKHNLQNIDIIKNNMDAKKNNTEKKCAEYGNIGFMWNDFYVDDTAQSSYNEKRGFKYSKQWTDAVLQRASSSHHKVRGVLRAHQHSPAKDDPMMVSILDNTTNHHGVSKLWRDKNEDKKQRPDVWNNMVCTFLVAPDSEHYNPEGNRFDFDAFAIMTTADTFDKWSLKVHKNELEKFLPKKDDSCSSVSLGSKL